MKTLSMIGAIFQQILPILGCLALIALVIVLIKVITLLNKLNKTMDTVGGTIDLVKGYTADMNVTVKTINNVAFSIEAVRLAIERLVKSISTSWVKQFEQLKSQVSLLLEKMDKKEKEKEEAVETIVVEEKKDSEATNNKIEEVKED